MYGFIEIFDSETILKTCKITEIPPNPSRKAQSIMLVEIAFTEIEVIILTPLVSSIIPLISPDENSGLIFNVTRIGLTSLQSKNKIPLLLIIDIITLKSTTNPPIITTVRVAVEILEPKILPKLLRLELVELENDELCIDDNL